MRPLSLHMPVYQCVVQMMSAAKVKNAETFAERKRSLQERERTGQRQRRAAAAAKIERRLQQAEALASYEFQGQGHVAEVPLSQKPANLFCLAFDACSNLLLYKVLSYPELRFPAQ